MSAALVVCGTCSRHVKRSESACPFCGATVAGARVSSGVPYVRMAAAAMVAAGAVAGIDCSDSSTPAYGAPGTELDSGGSSGSTSGSSTSGTSSGSTSGAEDAGDSGFEAGSIVALYGAPVFQNDAGEMAKDAEPDAPSVIALYGAPVIRNDASVEDAEPDAPSAVAAYGAAQPSG